jgi:hypothetical protein
MRLEDAVIDWGIHAGVTVMMSTPTVSRELTQDVRGMLSARQALSLILRDSGLTYTEEGERILVVPGYSLALPGLMGAEATTPKYSDGGGSAVAPHGKNGTGMNTRNAATLRDDDRVRDPVEIIVAPRRGEVPLQDIPTSVTSLSSDALANTGQTRLEDYYQSVPGLNLTPEVGSAVNLSIRGLNAGSGNPTVGITLDDVPFGSSSRYGGQNNSAVPDIDPSDLARVERAARAAGHALQGQQLRWPD